MDKVGEGVKKVGEGVLKVGEGVQLMSYCSVLYALLAVAKLLRKCASEDEGHVCAIRVRALAQAPALSIPRTTAVLNQFVRSSSFEPSNDAHTEARHLLDDLQGDALMLQGPPFFRWCWLRTQKQT